MILLTRINKQQTFYINEDLIEFIESQPETILTLTTGKKLPVSESSAEVVERVREEKRRIYASRENGEYRSREARDGITVETP
ncbi:MAG: flagellar FlbD family protein [Oscillospiraceae bacterium]|jgi:flagellar protein FlbD|nr:flagellar FlbD family protein [Oscillospiraceae bacterium]